MNFVSPLASSTIHMLMTVSTRPLGPFSVPRISYLSPYSVVSTNIESCEFVEVIEEFICITLGIACEGQKARFVILNAMGKQVIGQFTPRDRWMARQFHFRTQIVSNFRPTAYQELTAPGYFLTSSHLRVRADLRTESQTYWVSRASRKSGRARFFLPRESMKSAT